MASYAATTRFALIVALAFVVALVHPAAAARAEGAGPRLALVIGNASYRNVTPLANPVNDARLMSRRLDEAGFAVTTVTEADRRAMVEAVERFGRAVRAAGPDTLALFYFAGHGVRSDGFNFLVPLGVDIRAEADIARETVAAEWVLERLQAPGATSVMVLDACRDNPFDRGQRAIPDIGDGLARMTARRGDIIAYATGPGDVALDGAGANSPYTTALARLIATPGLTVEEMFASVRDEVIDTTGGLQVPWESSALETAVYLAPVPGVGPADAPAEMPVLRLAVSFPAGRGGPGALGCDTLYHYDPVGLPVSGDARRVNASNGDRGVALEIAARSAAGGVELSLLPVGSGATGGPVSATLDALAPGDRQTLYTGARHPDRFGCGPMTIYLTRER